MSTFLVIRTALVLVLTASLAGPLFAEPVGAEVGIDEAQAAAERQRVLRDRFPTAGGYDVKIPPPPRPGQAPRPEGGEATSDESETTGTEAEPDAGSERDSSAEATPAVEPTSGSTAKKAAPAPKFTLQVGAYRSAANARVFVDELELDFEDVYLSEVHSGGEPLYRIRVGKFATAEEREAVKKRLVAAGHPCFDVDGAFVTEE